MKVLTPFSKSVFDVDLLVYSNIISTAPVDLVSLRDDTFRFARERLLTTRRDNSLSRLVKATDVIEYAQDLEESLNEDEELCDFGSDEDEYEDYSVELGSPDTMDDELSILQKELEYYKNLIPELQVSEDDIKTSFNSTVINEKYTMSDEEFAYRSGDLNSNELEDEFFLLDVLDFVEVISDDFDNTEFDMGFAEAYLEQFSEESEQINEESEQIEQIEEQFGQSIEVSEQAKEQGSSKIYEDEFFSSDLSVEIIVAESESLMQEEQEEQEEIVSDNPVALTYEDELFISDLLNLVQVISPEEGIIEDDEDYDISVDDYEEGVSVDGFEEELNGEDIAVNESEEFDGDISVDEAEAEQEDIYDDYSEDDYEDEQEESEEQSEPIESIVYEDEFFDSDIFDGLRLRRLKKKVHQEGLPVKTSKPKKEQVKQSTEPNPKKESAKGSLEKSSGNSVVSSKDSNGISSSKQSTVSLKGQSKPLASKANKKATDLSNMIVKDSSSEFLSREEEPKDLREFLRRHPNCDVNIVLKYFTKKEVQNAITIGKVIRKGNKLRI